jgi:ABC-type Na+ transport system ATPase subunit NatA
MGAALCVEHLSKRFGTVESTVNISFQALDGKYWELWVLMGLGKPHC